MEYYDNILCISHAELTGGDPMDPNPLQRPILTEANFKYYKSKRKFRVVNRACYGTPALVAYNSLPDRIKEKVVAKYGDPESDTRKYVLKNMIVRDLVAERFYQKHTLDGSGNEHLRPEIIELYTMNASVLNAVINLAGNCVLCIKSYGKPFGRIWPEISRDLNDTQEGIGCRLPKNHLSLKRLVERYREGGYAALISGKHGNNNARINKLPEQDALIVELLGDGRNIDYTTASRLYNAVATKMGWKPISPSTMANYSREHPECFAGRHGKKALANEKMMQVKRTAPTCPMYFWCVDGWDTELFFQSHAVDETTGRSVTTYHNRPTVVAIVDPFNKYIIGYAIGTHESPALIRQAFRNAFEHVHELLGAYFKPWQIQTDNYGRGNLKSFYEACTYYYTPAAVGNAKAKIIEPFFNWFNRKYLRLLPNSSGHGVKSRGRIQATDEWIEAHKRGFPDYAGCRDQLEKMIEFDRNVKRDEYLKQWAKMPQDKRLSFDKEDFLYAFGETAAPRKLNSDGVRLQIGGQKFWYDCFDPEFREYGHATFFLRYNPSDMDHVMAIENVGTAKEPKEGTVRFMLERKYEQPMALMDRKEGDVDEWMRVRQFNEGMVDNIILKRKESGEIVRTLFEENADRLRDTLTAHVITDSLGRHKDVRNEVAGRKDKKTIPILEAEPADEDDFDFVSGEQDFLNEF
ncbi:hypothetical protein [Parabacteroides distasonis]|uniref:hypothetical protein n=1 Tax=Parabacteroides distasonis TaxID=823 RepID=UPI00189F97EB|nr:hypothetical protein [Parabacteroides distasonis]MDB9154222.1 hypothetical protein [Parabacteroides distasonis]MDB9158730.1 hypothetical protein [Parabacteroides distasonis]MDB9167508.1 hypothetical protein [Parabacteroides distasonis]MDB9172037.1 hypothetical protein [Parabacteroides distasonis]MDB9196246.1 hypothetical protein [Parabacteroides distasonis]